MWAQKNTREAAEIASKYWRQSVDLVEYAMSTPDDRIQFDRFIPAEDEMQYMANLMQHFGLIDSNNISGLVDDSFARNVDLQDIEGLESII